jgi:capsular exopolysaccharide synthesis family protein
MTLPFNNEPTSQPSPVNELTLRQIWAVAYRRRKILFRASVASLLLVLGVALFSTRRYESKGEIQIQKDASDALRLDSMMSGNAATESDALDATVTLQTEAKIMESQTLALKVISEMHLEREPDFLPKFSAVGWLMGFITPKGPSDPKGKPLGDSPKKRDQLLSVFKKGTKVAPVSGTRLIDISYSSTDPHLAAAIVNQMIEALVDYNFQTRYQATSQTSEWLSKQLSELRSTSDDLQKQVADLQRSSGVLSFGDQDLAGKGTVYSTALDQLKQATVNLTQAESNRILRGAVYEAAKSGNPEAVATLVSSGMAGGASSPVGQSLVLLEGLRAQEATQRAQISELSAKFGPAYTRLAEMKANLTSVQSSITQELHRLQIQAKSDYDIAQQVEDRTRATFEEQKRSAELLNDKAIQYQLLRQEADQSRDLYSKLQSRLKEAGVLEGLRSSNITVVEPGRIPSRPGSPNIILLLIAGLLGGPFIGIPWMIVAEMIDRTVSDPRAMASRFGKSFLGTIPRQPASRATSSSNTIATPSSIIDPQSPFSESFRSVRTALLLSSQGQSCPVIVVTSAEAQEGKTTLALNLAAQLARAGRRVLLVDGDLRRGTLSASDTPSAPGLSELLGQPTTESFISAYPQVDGLFLLPSGVSPENPAELLGSARTRERVAEWKLSFDFVIIDSAPLLPVADSLLLVELADRVIVVVRYGSTDTDDMEEALTQLHTRVPAVPVNIVLMAATTEARRYRRYATTAPAKNGRTPREVQIHA